jgi:exosortase E/protease (VPEID-CTERM system)
MDMWQSLMRRTGLLNLGLIVLMLGEVLGVVFCFDIHSIALHEGGAWIAWIGSARFIFQFALVFFAVLLLIEARCWKFYSNALLGSSEPYDWQPWVLMQVLVFTVFVLLTAKLEVTDSVVWPVEKSLLLITVWILLVPTFMLLWLCIFAPFQLWWQLLRKKNGSIIAAAFITWLVWVVSGFTESLWVSFNSMTFRLVYLILTLLYADVIIYADRFILGTPGFIVEVAKECSGYEGMGLVTVFLAVYLWLFRQDFRFPQVLLLFPVGLAVTWVFNAFRIAVLIAIGSSWSSEIALTGFHSQAGWIAFLLVALGLMWIAGRWAFFNKQAEPKAVINLPYDGELATSLLMPFIVLMATSMVIALFSTGSSDALYPLKIITTGGALWIFRHRFRFYLWQWSWPSLLIGIAVFLVWILLEPQVVNADVYPGWLADLPASYVALWLAFRVLGSVLLVPLVEELLFRGYLLRKLIASHIEAVDPRQFTWLSFIVSSVLFGLMHQRWMAGILAGMAYAYAQYRHGRLADAVLAHATTNALIAMAVLGFGRWGLWN